MTRGSASPRLSSKISFPLLDVFSTSSQPARIKSHKGVSTAYIPVKERPSSRLALPGAGRKG